MSKFCLAKNPTGCIWLMRTTQSPFTNLKMTKNAATSSVSFNLSLTSTRTLNKELSAHTCGNETIQTGDG